MGCELRVAGCGLMIISVLSGVFPFLNLPIYLQLSLQTDHAMIYHNYWHIRKTLSLINSGSSLISRGSDDWVVTYKTELYKVVTPYNVYRLCGVWSIWTNVVICKVCDIRCYWSLLFLSQTNKKLMTLHFQSHQTHDDLSISQCYLLVPPVIRQKSPHKRY